MHDLVTRLDAQAELRLVPYGFERAYGHPPETLWTAPYTVPLASGDLAAAVQWQVVVAAGRRSDSVARLASLDRPAEWIEANLDGPGEPVPDWVRLPYDVLRRAYAAGMTGGIDTLVHADLPEICGLSAAVPLACSITLAGAEHPAPARLAELLDDGTAARRAEVAAVLYGRADHVVCGRDWLPFDLPAAGLRGVLIVTRPLPPVAGPVDGGKVAALLRAGDLTGATALLTVRAADPPEVTAAIDGALAGGAVAAWPIGTGIVAIVPQAVLPELRAGLSATFREHAWRPPRFLSLRVAGAARRHT